MTTVQIIETLTKDQFNDTLANMEEDGYDLSDFHSPQELQKEMALYIKRTSK